MREKNITFIEFDSSTYRYLHMHASMHARMHTHTIDIIITATANINIMTEKILVRVTELSFQRSLERLNRISFADAFRQGIPERWNNIAEGPLAVPLCFMHRQTSTPTHSFHTLTHLYILNTQDPLIISDGSSYLNQPLT